MLKLRAYDLVKDLSALPALWNRRWGALFPLDDRLWEQNTIGDPLHFRADGCAVAMQNKQLTGFVGIKMPPSTPAWSGQSPTTGWISVLLMEPGNEKALAPRLIRHAVQQLQNAGMQKINYGSDPAHFFPGVPDTDETLLKQLTSFGFQPAGTAYDLFRELNDYILPERALEALQASELQIKPCSTPLVPALISFLEETFPGRWLYDTQRRLQVEPDASDILILTDNHVVYGFVHVYHRGSRMIGPNVYWRGVMGHAYGGLGPIGVAQSVRKQGLGFALLCYAVQHLKNLGVRSMAIDWTDLVDFYGKIGFTPWRTYRHASLTLT
jgi:GNAT superfamily N-acetyltransferase